MMNVFASNFSYGYGSSLNPREMTSMDLKRELSRLGTENASAQTVNSWKVEYYKKFSIPFGSIFFALLALPLAIIFGKHNGQTVGLIIGLVISVLYWAMLIGGQTFGYRSGFDGFWAMWIPNIVIGAAALFFYLRLIKR
jgi:lipopolysaccharide export system permease protein